jgi:CRP/FNR family transcriptional regulator, cyclic AMP receptor protein
VTRLDPVEALARSTVFRRLPREELGALAATMHHRRFARGRYLWIEGDVSQRLHVVLSGRIKVFRAGLDGDEVVLRLWLPGDSDGEPGLFAPDRVRLTSAQALEPTECVSIEREPLLAYLAAHPPAMHGMLERLSLLARQQTAQLSKVAFLDLGGRLARTLFELAAASGQPLTRGVRIPGPLSQRTLAGMVASRREAVNRALARLVAEGLVEHEHGLVTILDPEGLRRRFEPVS